MIDAHRDKRLSLLFLVCVTAATLYLSFVIAQPFLTPIVTATLLAIAIYIPLIRIFSPAEAAEVGMHLRERIPQRFRTRRACD